MIKAWLSKYFVTKEEYSRHRLEFVSWQYDVNVTQTNLEDRVKELESLVKFIFDLRKNQGFSNSGNYEFSNKEVK